VTDVPQGWLAAQVADLSAPGTAGEKRARLVDLTRTLLAMLPSVAITHVGKFNLARTNEIDIWFTHLPHVSLLPFSERMIPVECRNTKQIGADDVCQFASNVRRSGGREGVLVCRNGLSGVGAQAGGHAQIGYELAEGTRIVVICGSDLAELRTSDDLRNLLIDRFIELRTERGYRSI
jgi:hypothetical protein